MDEKRRQFTLPEFDVLYLNSTKLEWETIVDAAKTRWLLLHDWPVRCGGYNAERVAVALCIPAGYPDAEIDMAYFEPHLARMDGRAIHATSAFDLDGKSFQRWSRHRTSVSSWRPGEDDVSSHLVLVDDWLESELAKP